MHIAKEAVPAVEPSCLKPRAAARWHKDDSNAALVRYMEMTPLTERLLHEHEVVDAELHTTSVRARTHARKTAQTVGHHSLAVGRITEPQSRTFMDDQGLRIDGDCVPIHTNRLRLGYVSESAVDSDDVDL